MLHHRSSTGLKYVSDEGSKDAVNFKLTKSCVYIRPKKYVCLQLPDHPC